MHCRNKKQWELNASWPVKRRGSCTKSLFLCSRQVPVSNPCTNNGFLCTELAPNSNPCTFSLFLWRTIYQLAQLCRNALPKLRFAGWLKSCYSGRRHQHACCAARGRRHIMSAVNPLTTSRPHDLPSCGWATPAYVPRVARFRPTHTLSPLFQTNSEFIQSMKKSPITKPARSIARDPNMATEAQRRQEA